MFYVVIINIVRVILEKVLYILSGVFIVVVYWMVVCDEFVNKLVLLIDGVFLFSLLWF